MATEDQTFISDKEYKATGGSICPKCKSDQIEGGSFNVDSNGAAQEMNCLEEGCEFEWADVYGFECWCDRDGQDPKGKVETPRPQIAVVLDGGLVHEVLSDLEGEVDVIVFNCDRPDSDYPELDDWEADMDALAEFRKDDNMRDIQ